MNKVRHVTEPKREPRARAKAPGGVGQIGAMQGNHITSTVNTNYAGEDLTRGPGYSNPVGPTSFGNTGVGGGRKIYGSGSQCQYGSGGAEKPKGREILGEYGPESE